MTCVPDSNRLSSGPGMQFFMNTFAELSWLARANDCAQVAATNRITELNTKTAPNALRDTPEHDTMKPKAKIQTRPLKALLGLGLAFTTNLCLATDPIVANFDNSESIAGWANNGGNGTVEWSANQGVGASGAVKVTLDSSLGSEVDPAWTMGANSFNSALYWSVSFDIKIEATSGTDDAGSYGHLQVVPRSAAGS